MPFSNSGLPPLRTRPGAASGRTRADGALLRCCLSLGSFLVHGFKKTRTTLRPARSMSLRRGTVQHGGELVAVIAVCAGNRAGGQRRRLRRVGHRRFRRGDRGDLGDLRRNDDWVAGGAQARPGHAVDEIRRVFQAGIDGVSGARAAGVADAAVQIGRGR